MSEEKLGAIVYQDASYLEAALQTTKTGVDSVGFLVPILGPFIGSIIGNCLDSMREKRIREVVDSIKQYLEEMPEEICKSENFAEAVNKLFSHYVDEGSEEKRKILLNMYKAYMGLLPSKSESDRKKTFDLLLVFDELFKQLSLPSLLALIKHENLLLKKSTKGLIIKTLAESQEIHYMRCFSELVGQSLWVEEFEIRADSFIRKTDIYLDEHDKKYHLSPLGALFLAWLKNKLDDKSSQVET